MPRLTLVRLRAALLVTGLAACASSESGAPADDASTSGLDATEPGSPDSGGPISPTADAAPTACLSPVPDDPLLEARRSCSFGPGDLAAETLGLDEQTRLNLPIEHIVVVMKENRSFDHIFGDLAGLQPDAEVFPASFHNPDSHGTDVAPFHLNTTCVGRDPDHQWNAMHAQIHGGAMDGYITSAAASTGSDGYFALGYYDRDDLPFYYFLASTYAIADHYFPSVRSGTFPNRDYLLLGTSGNVHATQWSVWPDPSLKTIFEQLTEAGVSWGVYGDDHPLEETLNNPFDNWQNQNPWHPVQDLIDDFAAGTVPSVVFVDGVENVQDEHPTADVQVGEAWTRQLYEAAVNSPVWGSTVLLYTYDEAGGFFDHVPPASTCMARPEDTDFTELGTRVPLIAVSPWARRHHVAKTVKEHASILRFIQAVHGLPALTARDANSDALLDMFDFGCEPAPVPDAPAAGTGGCQGANLSTSKTSYDLGEPIVFTFSNGQGNPMDWIGVYPLGEAPHQSSTIWGYVGGGGHTATSGPTDGTITLAAGSQNNANDWPLHTGSWVAYFLIDDGYTPMASVQFDVH